MSDYSRNKVVALRFLIFTGISLLIIVPFVLSRHFASEKKNAVQQFATTAKKSIASFEKTAVTSAPVTTSAITPSEHTQHLSTGIIPADLNGVKPIPFTIEADFSTPAPSSLLQTQALPVPTAVIPVENDSSPYFHLVSGSNPPGWWVAPVLSVLHNNEGIGRLYFNMKLENLDSYKDVYSDYSYKIECLSHPQLNRRQCITPYGLPGEINELNLWQHFKSQWLGIMPLYDLCVKAKGLIYTLTMKYYTTFEDEVNLILMPGMVLKYRFTYRANGFEQVYEKNITLCEVGTGVK